MMRMMQSRKGYKTFISIVALIFIVFTFIVFMIIFRMDKDRGQSVTSGQFGSIDTELALKTFLQTPSSVDSKDIGYSIGEIATEADLLSRTCGDSSDLLFKNEAKEFYNTQYGRKWRIQLIYYKQGAGDSILPSDVYSDAVQSDGANCRIAQVAALADSSALTNEVAGHEDPVYYDLALLKLNIRDEHIGSQVLPCRQRSAGDPSAVKVVLFQWEDKGDCP